MIAGLLLALRSSVNPYAQVLRRARLHLDALERTAAVSSYREAARLRPQNPVPHVELAALYRDWGRFEQALASIEEAEERGADAIEMERMRLLTLGKRAETSRTDRLHEWETVADQAQRLLEIAPSDCEALLTLARARLELREWKAAQSVYEELLALEADHDSVRDGLGILSLGHDPRATELLRASGTELAEQVLEAFGSVPQANTAHAYALVGRVLAEQEAWPLAARHFGQAVLERPDYADAHAYLGHALDQMGYEREARSHLAEAVYLAPDSALAHAFLGLHHDRRGDLEAARGEYEKAYDLAPDSSAICAEIGQTWVAEGRYEVAEVWLEEAVALSPSDPDLWEMLGRFYLDLGAAADDRLVEVTERVLDMAPDRAMAHELRARAAFQRGDYPTADRHLRRAIELDEDSAFAYYHLGLLRKDQGRQDEAARAFDRAVDLDTTGALLPLVERAR